MVKSCVNNTLRWTVGCCAIAETVIATAESVKSPNTLAALTIGFFINASLIHQWIEGLSDTLPIGRSMGDCAARRHATLLPSTRPRLPARRRGRVEGSRVADRKSTRLNSSHTVISY